MRTFAPLALAATLLWACATEVGDPPGPVSSPNPDTSVVKTAPPTNTTPVEQKDPLSNCKLSDSVEGTWVSLNSGSSIQEVVTKREILDGACIVQFYNAKNGAPFHGPSEDEVVLNEPTLTIVWHDGSGDVETYRRKEK